MQIVITNASESVKKNFVIVIDRSTEWQIALEAR